ncbi:MAG: LruC domain-containing protein [Prevotella sp.]|nr:LruC domain-containing protein [Prevotella sp.]
MKCNYKSLIFLGLISLGFVSCDDEDYFDKERYQELISQAFPVDKVDSTHDWKTVSSVLADITVNMVDPCTVKIYNSNPLSGKAAVLMERKVESGGAFQQAFSCETVLSTLYIAMIDSKGYVYVKPAKVENGRIIASVGTFDTSSAKRRTMETGNLPTATLDVTAEEFLDGAVEVNKENSVANWADDPNYALKLKITGEWNGNIPVLGSEGDAARTLYVSGTWTISGEQKLGGVGKIMIANGGKIIIPEDSKLATDNGGRVIVLVGGAIEGNGLLEFSNGSDFSYNAGSINLGTLNNNGGKFFNYGSVMVDRLEESTGIGMYVNWGNTTMKTTSKNIVVYNGCRMEITENFDEPTKVVLAPSSFLNAAKLSYASGSIYVGSNAIFNVSGDASFNGCTLSGPSTGDYGVMQLGSVSFVNVWDTRMQVINNLYISIEKELADGDNNTYNQWNTSPYTKLTVDVMNKDNNGNAQGNGNAMQIAPGGANIVIEPSECNPGYSSEAPDLVEEPFGMRFCFEDNFPMEGDYEFNDVVLTVTPAISGKTVNLTVSLDAVGATEQIAAAIRVAGVLPTEVVSVTADGSFDFTNRPVGSAPIIDSEEIILPSTLNASGNLVINLFNDAHLAMGRQAEKHGLGVAMETNGNVRRWFYNTVERDNALESKVNDVPPVVVTYTLEMNSESAAQRFVAGNIDAFIVEGYNGGYWEVHTYPFKTSQVLLEYAGKDLSYYTDNYVWAVQVPATFKYPKEWTSIGAFKNNMLTGAYQTNGHSFGEWATDKTKATDWYNYPTKGMIYE